MYTDDCGLHSILRIISLPVKITSKPGTHIFIKQIIWTRTLHDVDAPTHNRWNQWYTAFTGFLFNFFTLFTVCYYTNLWELHMHN